MPVVGVIARLAGVALVVAGLAVMWWPVALVAAGAALFVVGHEVSS